VSRTPDSHDGPLYEEAVIWEEQSSNPATELQTQYVQNKGLVILEDGVVHGVGESRENVWQGPVDDQGINTPPGSPSTGYRVIVGGSPTGAFVSHEGEIAQWNSAAWVFTTPKQGSIVTVKDENEPYKQTAAGAPWVWALVSAAADGVSRADWYQNGFADHSDVDLAWNDGTRTLTVSPAVTSFKYYLEGVPYTETGNLTETITDTEGLWVFYIDSEGSMTSLNSPSHAQADDIIVNYTIVAFVLWDAVNNDGRLMPELHGALMSPETHHYLHGTVGAAFEDGMALSNFVIGDGDTDSHAQFSVAEGEFYDEDFGIELAAVASTVGLEIWRLVGSDWRWTTVAGFSVLNTGTGRLAWNDGGTQAEVAIGDFVLCHVFATNITADDGTVPKYIAIQGQATYATANQARDGAETEIANLAFGVLPLPELLAVGTVIFQTANVYDNVVQGRVVLTSSGGEWVDWRTAKLRGASGTSNDHGSLAGLSDDDHEQYLLADGTRAMSGSLDMGANAVTNVGNVDGRDVSADGSTLDTHVADVTGNPHAVTAAQVGTTPGIDSTAIHDNVAAEISVITEKVTPVSGDFLVIEDSAAANAKKRVQVGNLPGGGGTDPDAIHDDVAAEISAITEKVAPASADFILIEDSADSNNKKRVQIGNLPSGVTVKMFQGIDVTGAMAVTNVAQTVPLTSEVIKDDYYTHSTSVLPGEVTISTAGWYRVTAMLNVTAVDTAAGIRGNPQLHFDLDTGGGWVQQSQVMSGYIRENNGYLSTAISMTSFFDLGAGDKIRFTVLDSVASEPNEQTTPNGSRLLIEYIDRTGPSAGGGGGDTITVNGSATASTDVDLDDSLPAAPAGEVNVKWQKDALDPTNVSASVQASSEAQKGVIEIATQGETDTGTDDARAVTPLKLATTTVAGIDSTAVHDNVNAEISAVTEKVTPVSGDFLLIEDSAASNAKKRVQVGNLPGGSGTDSDAIHDNVAAEISAITEKASPISADLLVIEDSADSNNKKRVQVGNLPGGSGTDSDAIHDNVDAEINAIADKASPVGADVLIIEDSAASYAKKKVSITNLPGGADADAIHDNVSAEISAVTEKTTPVSADLLLIEDSADSNSKKRVQIGNLPGGGSAADSQYFDAYDSTGGTSIDAGWTDVPLITERKKTSDFTHVASSAEVTIGEDGTYLVHASVSVDASSGTSRSDSLTRLMIDTGSGYVEVAGVAGGIYNRQATQGHGTATRVAVLDLDSGDKLKMQAMRNSGTNLLILQANGSALVISRVEGIGATGADGADGDTGPTGSGSDVIVQDEGVSIPNTPHGTLNFEGDGVTVTDAGSDEALITIPGGSSGGLGLFSLYDHFMHESFYDSPPFTWDSDVGGGSLLNSDPHWLRIRTGTASGSYATIIGRTRIVAGSPDPFTIRWRAQIVSEGGDADGYTMFGGMHDTSGILADHIWVNRGTNANTVKFVTTASSSATTTDNIAMDPHTMREYAVVVTASDAKLYIDGVLKATHTTTIPSTALVPGFSIDNDDAGEYKHMALDYVALLFGVADYDNYY